MLRIVLLLALLFTACGPAGGPEGRALRVADAGTSTSTVTDAGQPRDAGAIDAGVIDAGPGCPGPLLHDLREQIFLTSCAGCHGGTEAEPAEALDLTLGLEALRTRLAQPARQSPTGVPLVTPGNAAASYLYLKVFLETPLVGERMPPEARLRACEIDALSRWIEAGAED